MVVISMRNFEQLARYYIAGILINVLGYVAFLTLLQVGLGAKSSAVLLFAISMLVSFWINRSYVFQSNASIGPSFTRYVVTALVALLLNIAIISLFVDHWEMPAEGIQLFSIVVVSMFLFVANKFLVHKIEA